MDRSNAPHVCFKTEDGATRKAEARIMELLAQHLRKRLDGFSLVFKRRWFVPVWVCKVQLGQERFGLTLVKNRYSTAEIILQVCPLTSDGPGLLTLLRGGKLKPYVYTEALKGVCREIQVFLTSLEGISRVRWYFESDEKGETGSATPDELRW